MKWKKLKINLKLHKERKKELKRKHQAKTLRFLSVINSYLNYKLSSKKNN